MPIRRQPPLRPADLSLMQQVDPRAATLARMRGKLAAPSQASLRAEARREAGRRRAALGWGWKLAIAAALIATNVAWFGGGSDLLARARTRHAPALPPPAAALSLDDQALFWAYALYDFDKLREKFGVPAAAVIDANEARRRLAALLPKVDAGTRLAIEAYHPLKGGRG